MMFWDMDKQVRRIKLWIRFCHNDVLGCMWGVVFGFFGIDY